MPTLNGSIRKILVVDDDIIAGETISELISTLGYLVVLENNALCAIRTMIREEPDLVLLDLNMPGANGLQILRTMGRKRLRIPVVIISGFIGQEEFRSLLDHGVRHIIAKPVQLNVLENKIAQALRKNVSYCCHKSREAESLFLQI